MPRFSKVQRREYSRHVLRRCGPVARRILADQLAEVFLAQSVTASLSDGVHGGSGLPCCTILCLGVPRSAARLRARGLTLLLPHVGAALRAA